MTIGERLHQIYEDVRLITREGQEFRGGTSGDLRVYLELWLDDYKHLSREEQIDVICTLRVITQPYRKLITHSLRDISNEILKIERELLGKKSCNQ